MGFLFLPGGAKCFCDVTLPYRRSYILTTASMGHVFCAVLPCIIVQLQCPRIIARSGKFSADGLALMTNKDLIKLCHPDGFVVCRRRGCARTPGARTPSWRCSGWATWSGPGASDSYRTGEQCHEVTEKQKDLLKKPSFAIVIKLTWFAYDIIIGSAFSHKKSRVSPFVCSSLFPPHFISCKTGGKYKARLRSGKERYHEH